MAHLEDAHREAGQAARGPEWAHGLMRLDVGMATRARVRAPELVGKGGWLNTGGKDLSLADFRGRILVLDFWMS